MNLHPYQQHHHKLITNPSHRYMPYTERAHSMIRKLFQAFKNLTARLMSSYLELETRRHVSRPLREPFGQDKYTGLNFDEGTRYDLRERWGSSTCDALCSNTTSQGYINSLLRCHYVSYICSKAVIYQHCLCLDSNPQTSSPKIAQKRVINAPLGISRTV